MLKADILGVLMNLVRTSSLAGRVDPREVVGFVATRWPKMFSQGTLDVSLLHRELVNARGLAAEDVAKVLLVLKKRELQLGVAVKLPDVIARMPVEKQEALLREVLRSGVTSGVTLTGLRRVEIPDGAAPAKGARDGEDVEAGPPAGLPRGVSKK
jgi:hypothetical protein